MKNFRIFASLSVAVFMVYFLSACAGSKDFVSNNFERVKPTHRIIAILPFDVRFDNSQNQKNQNPKRNWSEQERQGSIDMQKDLFIALAKQVQKGRYEVAFQDFSKTNKILGDNNIAIYDIAAKDKAEIAKLLGVDAVIWGQTDVKITKVNRNSYSPYAYNSYNRGIYNDGVTSTANIYDASTNEMVWSTNQSEHPTSRLNTPHELASRVMDYVAKRLPYRLAKR